MTFKYLDADQMRIACTGLTGRIMAGVPDKEARAFVGVVKDVTSDCLKAVVDHVLREDTNCLVVTANGKPAYEIVVRRIGETN